MKTRAGRSARTMRAYLVALILLTVAPVVTFAAIMVERTARLEREAVERGLRDSVRALALAVDRELARIEAILLTLAGSPSLAGGDLRTFYEEASRAARQVPGSWIVFTDPAVQQRVNTRVPYGTPLPRGAAPDLIRTVVQTGKTGVSDLFVGALIRRPVIAIAVPVKTGDAVVGVVDMALGPETLNALLAAQRLPPDWIGVLTDRKNRVVARARDAEKYVGQSAPGFWIQGTAGRSDGFLHGTSLEGPEVDIAFERSQIAGWTVGLAVFRDAVETPLRRARWVVAGGGAALLAVGLALAAILGNRITAAVTSLRASADALRRSELPAPRPSVIQEVNEVQRALEQAALALAEQARERERLVAEQTARREAEAANRAKDEFLAVLSHELRTPLTTMLGWVRMLRSGRIDPLRTERALEAIERNTLAQTRMIDDLLDMSRIAAGKITLDRGVMDLGLLIAEVVEGLQNETKAKGLTLDVQLDPAASPVSADPHRLRQVFTNLLTNALKFTPSGGRVQVYVAAATDAVRLVVRDTGIGIEPQLLPHVFERFRQADWRQAGTQGGLGLGLAIARQIVELHGGTVDAHSDGLGRGATFIVTLPVATG